jgi:segregation and condensation protein B
MSNEVESRPVKSSRQASPARKRPVKVDVKVATTAVTLEEAPAATSAAAELDSVSETPVEAAATTVETTAGAMSTITAEAPTTVPVAIDPATDEMTIGSIEAVLLSVDRPVSAVRLAEALGLLDEAAADKAEADGVDEETLTNRKRGKAAAANSPLAIVRRAVQTLNQQYETTGRAFRIESVAGGYRLMTLARFAPVIEEFLGKRERTSLSRAAVETLAIIAYKQPITRAKLEAVRGVACGEVLRTLIERRLVTITGRAEELGRPMLYGTTKQFLEAFGLAGLKDLPSAQEFKARHTGGGGEE